MARWRIVPRRGELERAVATQWQQRLYAALAKAALAHHQRTAMVLQRPGDDFRSRSRSGIDQHDNRQIAGNRSAKSHLRIIIGRFAARSAALGNDPALVEKQVRQRDRLVERTARI